MGGSDNGCPLVVEEVSITRDDFLLPSQGAPKRSEFQSTSSELLCDDFGM